MSKTLINHRFLATLNQCCIACNLMIILQLYLSYFTGRILHSTALTGDPLMVAVAWSIPFIWFYVLSMILNVSCYWISTKMIFATQFPLVFVMLLYLIQIL